VLLEPSLGVGLAVWIAAGMPAAVATARLDSKAVALLVFLTGPVAWPAWALARRHQAEARTAACSRRFLIEV